MSWSPQQDAALKAVDDWLKQPASSRAPIFRLFGWAGTGKTTLARFISDMLTGTVLFAAYTGKAALVLKQKGCDAKTIHRLIYFPKGASEGVLKDLKERLIKEQAVSPPDLDLIERLEVAIYKEAKGQRNPSFTLNEFGELSEDHVQLLIVDECSMVGTDMAKDLLSFNVPILVLGDPAQLPPIAGGGYFTEAVPDIMLTEIHRQAKDNPIIEMARRVRMGEGLPLGTYGDCQVVARGSKLDAEAYDQVLCGRNVTRHALNDRLRTLNGFGADGYMPEPGERLVCLKNDHKIGLLNGGLWNVVDAADVPEEDEFMFNLESQDDDLALVDVMAWRDIFRREDHVMGSFERMSSHEFDFGYALTCHKAQGSQWPNVMVMDESGVFRKSADRWLYTAITRASEKVDIVK